MIMTNKLDKQFLAVILIALITFSIGIHWGLPLAVSPETVEPWGVDTIAPLQPLNEAYYKFSRQGNEWIWYPLFHYIVLDVVYTPYIAFQYLSGSFENPSPDFPYGLKDPGSFCRDLTLIARMTSILMALVIIIAIFKITEGLFTRRAAFWAALIATIAAPLTFYSKSSNLDVPYLCWTFLAIWQYVKIIRTQKLRYYVLFSIFIALAVATKDQAYGFFVLIPFVILIELVRFRSGGKISIKEIIKAMISKPVVLSVILTIFVYMLANNLIFGGLGGFINRLTRYNELITAKRAQSENIYTVQSQLATFFGTGQMMLQTLGFGSLILCFLGIFHNIYKKNWLALSILLFAISYYLFLISQVLNVHVRYVLGFTLILVPFAGYLIDIYLKKTGMIKKFTIYIAIFSIICQVILTINLMITLIGDSRYQAERWIEENIPIGTKIESNVLEKFLPHISDSYDISVEGVNELNKEVPEEFNSRTLQERNPQYIIVVKGIGVSGDPDTIEDPAVEQYFKELISGNLDYTVLVSFKTPNFLSFRQIVATNPTCTILGKKNAL